MRQVFQIIRMFDSTRIRSHKIDINLVPKMEHLVPENFKTCNGSLTDFVTETCKFTDCT